MTGDDAASTAALAPSGAEEADAVAVDPVEVAGERVEPLEFASFAEYYRADALRLVVFLMRLGAGEHDAADIAHSVLGEMLRNWERVRSPRRWARDQATWALYKKPLSAQHETLTDVLPDSAASAFLSPEHHAEVAESARRVRALLAPLSERQRAVMAYRMEGFSYREIAKAIQTTPAGATKIGDRARAILKDRVHADRQPEEER